MDWILARSRWVIWGFALGAAVALMTIPGHHPFDRNALDGFEGTVVAGFALVAGLVALAIRFVAMSESDTKREWPILIMFPLTTYVSFACVHFLVSTLMRMVGALPT
jgi:fermentation-respiration switch protein FrsA (DUF1100 family)